MKKAKSGNRVPRPVFKTGKNRKSNSGSQGSQSRYANQRRPSNNVR
jgi:hypothetical protein